jgi:O-antigen/teichoic acid export membrane protein
MLKRIFYNFSYLAFGQAISGVLYFVATIFIARHFGVGEFGIFSFAEASFFFFSLIVLFGTDIIGAREVSQAEGPKKNKIVNQVIFIRSIFSLVSFIVFIAFIVVLRNSLETKLMILLCVFAIFSLIFLLDWFFWGEERFIEYSQSAVIRDLSFFGGVLLLIYFSANLLWVGVVFFVSKFIGTVFLLGKYIKEYGFSSVLRKFSFNRTLFNSSSMMFVTTLVGWVVGYFDIFALSVILGVRDTGLYGAACKPIAFFLLAIMVSVKSVFPYLSKTARDKTSDFRKIIIFALFGISVFFIPLMALGPQLSTSIITVIYGNSFVESGRIFYLLVFAAFIISVNTIYSRGLIAVGEDKSNLIANVSVGSVNILSNLILIPIFGFIGAALSKIIGDGLIFFYYHRKLSNVIHIPMMKIVFIPVLAILASTILTNIFKLNSGVLWVFFNSIVYFLLIGGTTLFFYRNKNFLFEKI